MTKNLTFHLENSEMDTSVRKHVKLGQHSNLVNILETYHAWKNKTSKKTCETHKFSLRCQKEEIAMNPIIWFERNLVWYITNNFGTFSLPELLRGLCSMGRLPSAVCLMIRKRC